MICFISRRSPLARAALALPLVLLFCSAAHAVEEAEKFLNGLRERGYYDTAAEYLEQIKDSPLLPPEFKKTLAYEQGVTLVDAARASGDVREREALYEKARALLETFVQQNAGTELAAKANGQLANVLVERARAALLRAESPTQAANKERLQAEARSYFEDSEKLFAVAESFYRDELEKMKGSVPEDVAEKRQQYRAELVQARLLIATVIYEKAKSYDEGTEDRKALLKSAAEKYGDMYDKFRTFVAGLYARLYQGRCLQEMGDYDDAMLAFEDVIAQPENAPVFRTLISKGYAQLVECLVAQEKYDDAIARGQEWLKKARGAEERSPDWLAVKYQVALALEKKADATTDESDKRKVLREARDLAKDVTRSPNEYKEQAEELMARLGAGGGEDEIPTKFADAFEAGRDAINLMQSTQAIIPAAEKNNPDEVAKLQEQALQAREKAQQMFTLALGLVDEETEVDRINLVRYYLCYLNWEAKQYYDAAILGEFLAEKYPQSGGARQAAKIAMAAYLSVYNQPGNPDKEFDAERVVRVATLITERWPTEPEADEAYDMLITFMLQQDRFEEAEQYLEKMSPDFAGRGKAELKVGQSMWAQYVKRLRAAKEALPEGEEELDSATLEQLAALKQKAQVTLETGVERMRSGTEISPTVASAGLSLAQIYLDTSQYQKAVGILEDETLGPLTLVAANHEATQTPGYAEEAYKSALRAYVTVTPPQQEKAESVMDALEQLVAQQGGDAAEKLTLIFISLGLQLQDQIAVLKDEGKDEEIKQVAQSFEVFLDRVGKREKGNDWASRNWVASTYFNLGSGFDNNGKLSQQGVQYYKKAIAAYNRMLQEAKENPEFAPNPDLILGVKMRIAECLRKLREYSDALNLLAEILEQKPMMLEAQVIAAETYQERGLTYNPQWLYYARQGGRKDPKTHKERIWGWGRLAQIVARYPQYQDIFHKARYNLTYCRLAQAQKIDDAKEKKALLDQGKEDLRILMHLYPDLGGPLQREKYDRLLKDIQRELREKPIGLDAFPKPTVQASN